MIRRRARSLAAALLLPFILGSALVVAGVGYALYHALGMRLEANDVAEIRGKTEAIEKILADVQTEEAMAAAVERLRDLPAGHPHLSVGVRYQGRWLLSPAPELARQTLAPTPTSDTYGVVRVGERTWITQEVHHAWQTSPPGSVSILLSVETSETRQLLREHAISSVLGALVGTLVIAVWAWIIVRRGLRPLAVVAGRAEAVTASRLGERLDLQDAPREVHGIADSINRMLERLEESFLALEQFSADIAHELRTPLNNLLVQTQVTLGRARTPEEYQEALHSNLEELERLQHMVADMLFLARADRGIIDLKLEAVALRPEIESVAEYFEAAASERSQAISVVGEGIVRADRLMVRRAMNNLLSNAVRYSPRGSTIQVNITSDADDCIVTVINPGEAIPAEEILRLFKRFARRDISRGRGVEGAGLGLAIVESIMKVLGGSVSASAEGERVSFALRFPAANLSNL